MARDGRRVSSPLTDPSNAPSNAPSFQLNRHVVADDAASVNGVLPVAIQGGCNFKGYQSGQLQVIPRVAAGIGSAVGGVSTWAVTVFEYSEALGAFVQSPDLTITSPGAGEAFFGSLDVKGRRLFFHVTGLSGSESVSLYASGFDFEPS